MKTLKELEFDFFSNLEGKEFTGTSPDGKEVTVTLKKAHKEEPPEEAVCKEFSLRQQPFSLQFEGVRDSLPRQCSIGLKNEDVGEIEPIFLVTTGQNNEKLFLTATFT